MPSLSSMRRTTTCGPFSTRKKLRPRPPLFLSGSSLRASTRMTSPQPLVIKRLVPEMFQAPVTGSCRASMPPALVCTLARSLPASGSVRAMAPVISPVAMRGRYLAFSSSVPKCWMVSAMPPCRPKKSISEASARETISMAAM